jgi:hypothetical protein
MFSAAPDNLPLTQWFGGQRVSKVTTEQPTYEIALRDEFFSAYFAGAAMAAGAKVHQAQQMMDSIIAYFEPV